MKKNIFLFLFNLLIISQLQAQTTKKLIWEFPITRPHAGILLGNGTQGLMVWGSENKLEITIGRAGFWDHRGGNDFATRTTYQDVKKMLEANDETSIKKVFEVPKKEGKPNFGYPQQIGGGRLEITLPTGWKLTKGELILEKGEIQLMATNLGKMQNISIRQAVFEEVVSVNFSLGLVASKVKIIPAYDFTKEQMAKVGIEKPILWTSIDPNSGGGFLQRLPEDLPLGIGFQKQNTNLTIVSALRYDAREVIENKLKAPKSQFFVQEIDVWWKKYWESVPKVNLPDPALQEIYDYGLYKQACSTPPQGVACTLQGAFMEDYQIVPWSNDYHFNINAEMIYYPALMSGRFEHFKPLWKMIESWKSEISKNGETFFNRKGALMLPHAVDDKCKVVGTFWTGTIDHACTAWMAQLAWLHYRYSGDKKVLETMAYPLLVGAFEGYFAMLEEVENAGNKRYSLPISVSPEYRGSAMNAWGKDASFQLAALHSVCKNLQKAATILGKPVDYRWDDVDKRLPDYTTIEGEYQQEWHLKNKRIALWEGMDLVESHRHHAHLGSIYPFVTIDPQSEKHNEIVQNSLATWRYRGAGGWSGWCVPWASILLARTGQTEAAVNWLHYWKDNFTNEGRGTLHNANTNGNSIIGSPVWAKQPEKPAQEVMQLDAGFGALTAIYELLVQNRLDGIYILPDLSIYWKNMDFQDVWAEGGFKLSAKVQDGKVLEVKIKCTQDGTLKLHHNLGEKYVLNGVTKEGKIFEKPCKIGEELVLKRP